MDINLGRIVFLLLFPPLLFAEITLKLELSKDEIHLNETIKATLVLEYTDEDEVIKVADIDFDGYRDFSITKLEPQKLVSDTNLTTYKYGYLLEPKSVGAATLPRQEVKLSTKKDRFVWTRLYTDERNITIKPLYQNLPIQGSYEIEAVADKTAALPNKPINLKLVVRGEGNIQEIGRFDLGLKNQLVFSDAPEVNASFKERAYSGEFVQRFSILADRSFTIPSLKLTYYDIDAKMVKDVTTKPIFINIDEQAAKKGDSPYLKYLFGVIGIALGVALLPFYRYLQRLKLEYKSPLAREIKNAKSDKELYDLLLPYSKNSELAGVMRELEENIYRHNHIKIDKKKITKVLLKTSFPSG